MNGFVYFIETEDARFIKIGFTRSLFRRLSELGTLRPIGYGVRLIGYIEGTQQTESELHRRFQFDRNHGEWFQSTDELRRNIETMGLLKPRIELKPPKNPRTRKEQRQELIEDSPRIGSVLRPQDCSKGGRIGGKRRAEVLTPQRRIEIARNAILARWSKVDARNREPRG